MPGRLPRIVVLLVLSLITMPNLQAAPPPTGGEAQAEAPPAAVPGGEAGTPATAGEELLKKKKGEPLVVYWKSGLNFSTADEKFWMKIGGNLHFDTKAYGSESANPTQFDVRRARLDLQGDVYRFFKFRLQTEFADTPYIRNAWFEIAGPARLHLRGGQMKPPFSTSWYTLDNQVNFLERGSSTPIYPFFDRGWWLWGDLFEEALVWNLATFTGAGMELDVPRGDLDDHKDTFARLFANPFKDSENEPLRGLYLCLQGSRGRETIPTARFETKGLEAPIRDDKFWTWETESPGNGTIDRRDRWGAELHYLVGAFSLSSEYLVARYEGIRVYAEDGTLVLDESGEVANWSTWAGYFLTGEAKSVSNEGWRYPSPQEDFDPRSFSGRGAWEVLLRYSRTETSSNLFDEVEYGGESYRILRGADSADEFTLGVNWAWNPTIRWQLNYTRIEGEEIRTGDSTTAEGTKRLDSDDMLGLRIIIRF